MIVTVENLRLLFENLLKKMDFWEFDTLEKELEILPPFHQVAFAASCCERLLPNYNAFCRQVDWGDPSVPRNALDEAWQILGGKQVNSAQIEQLIEDCGGADIFPEDLDFGDNCLEAQEALMAIRATLQACLDPTVKRIVKVVESTRYTIETHIPYRDNTFDVTWEKDGEETFYEAIANHPLAVREMAKEAEDLQRLKETEILDKDFLEWLRTSFDNEGKSLIDLG